MENAEVVDAPQAEQAAAPTASLAVFDPIQAGLAVAKQRYANVAFDLKTVKGNDEARKARKELVSLRTGVEKAYEQWNQPLLAQQRKARSLVAEITKEVEALEKPIDEQIKADERRRENERLERERIERERVATIRARINDMFAQPAACAGLPSSEIELSIVAVEVSVADKAFYQELQGEAEAAADVVLAKLRAMLANAQAAEAAAETMRLEAERLAAERAELERLRAEADARAAAERAELERQRAELVAQQEAAREEAERLEAERQAAAAAEAARMEAERAAAEAADQARQAAIAEEARRAEEDRLAAEREAKARLDEQRRRLDEQRAQLERDQAAARAQADAAAQQAAAEEKLLAEGYTKLVSPGLNGSTVISWAPPAREAVAAEPEEPAKPELRTQEDAFAEERAAAAQAIAANATKATRPADERLTAAVAKAFGVTQFTAAEWLGTYDALAEIDRTLEQQL